MSKEKIFGDWNDLLKEEYDAPYFKDLSERVKSEYNNKSVLPKSADLFKIFRICPLSKIKVVILGLEPYCEKEHSNGVAFASNSDIPPKQLIQIRDSLNRDIKFGRYMNLYSGNNTLDFLLEQGVLLLNTRLTVVENQPSSHRTLGWDMFIARVLKLLVEHKNNIVFLGWGKEAMQILNVINTKGKDHFFHFCEHPSTSINLNREWDNKDCFNLTNEYLKIQNLDLIVW